MVRAYWAGAIAASIVIFAATATFANEVFPSRTVKLVVPSAAGSAPDNIARVLASKLTEIWGQSVIVENMSGAGLNIGASYVARSAPDGYTLMVSPPPPITVNNLLYRGLTYQTDEFVPITMLVQVPNVLIVRNDVPARNLKEFIDYAKAIPGKVTYGSQGLGSTGHLTARLFESMTGISMTHVPYRGEMLILNDVVAGHVDVFFGTLSTGLPLFQSGKLKYLAVASRARNRAVPDVPTIDESGLPGFQSAAWFALVGPPGLPNELVAKLNQDVLTAVQDPAVSGKLRDLRLDVIVGTPSAAKDFITRETELWTRVIKEANVPVQ